MPIDAINGVRIYWEAQGTGAPLVLVHGSWGDHDNWAGVVPDLARTHRVVTYDRRGHSASERAATPGSVDEDVADLAALLAQLQLAPAHVVGNSFGATIVLKLAAERPDLFATLAAHEPPLIGLLGDDPAVAAVQDRIGAVVATLQTGDHGAGARQFVETVALGPGMWDRLPPDIRQTFIRNAPTWLDEVSEPGAFMLDLARLAAFDRPVLLTHGDQSPPFFGAILDRVARALPHAARHLFGGAGHAPHLTHPEEFVRIVGAPSAA